MPVQGWKCPMTGDVYPQKCKSIVGYGNPPSSPRFQRENPGMGRMPMQPAMIDDEELTQEQIEEAKAQGVYIAPPEPTPTTTDEKNA